VGRFSVRSLISAVFVVGGIQERSYSILLWGGASGVVIEVGTIQAVAKKRNYIINTVLGGFKNIQQYIIKNAHTLNSN